MEKNKKILIIIPAYNEADTVGKVIEKIKQRLPFVDILVVNDGSFDLTSIISKQKGALVLDLPYNLGIGAAVQAGYKFAHKMDYDMAVQCDADGQHHPAEIKKLIDTLINDGVDIVIGSRYLKKNRYKSPFWRRFGVLIFYKVVSFIVKQRLTDTTSGFRAVNREVIKSFSIFYPSDYPEVESLVMLHREGFGIKEIPINMSSRKIGRSSIVGIWRPFYYMIKVFLAIFIDLCEEVPYKKRN